MLCRRIVFMFFAALFYVPTWVMAQGDTAAAAKWHFSIQQQDGNTLRLVATGEASPGWGVFSLAMPDDMPHTRWVIDTTEGNWLLEGKERAAPVRERSELLSTDIAYHKGIFILEAVVQTSGKPVKGAISYMAFRGEEFTNPVEVPFRIVPNAQGKYQLVSAELAASALASQKIKRATIDMDHPVANCGGTGAEGPKSLWRIFMLGVLGGLLGLVMPCTFPMIPMTVSFFTKKSNDHSKGIRNAFLYGFFIFLIYVLISIPFYFLEAGNEDILNNISTNAWLNLLFALIFFLFALSFFGLYEIGLPSSFANKVDARSNLGSVGGIFFMALTLAIVSFSCTGPILGTLLVGALNEEGGALQLTIAMAGFGLALGLPFGLFALFPRWLARLPRSGSWMNTVKMVFAFIELALMVKFLSNADLVMHWGLLKREVFIGIWIILSLLTSLYLFGIVRFKHDPPPPRLSQGRIMSAILFLLFTVYLLPGVSNTRYANLSLISGFPPPLSYSIYGHGSAKGKGVEAMVVNDYEKALQISKETGKPVLLDFTGWACVNCRKMEENVWPDSRIRELIENNFILVSLYVDDRKALPDDQQFLHTLADGSTKKIRTVGDLYATMQSENFRNASQPLYAILNADEQLLNLPVGYTPNANTYLQWLECGLSHVKKQ